MYDAASFVRAGCRTSIGSIECFGKPYSWKGSVNDRTQAPVTTRFLLDEQSKVWTRFHHESLRALQQRSRRYVQAYRQRAAAASKTPLNGARCPPPGGPIFRPSRREW